MKTKLIIAAISSALLLGIAGVQAGPGTGDGPRRHGPHGDGGLIPQRLLDKLNLTDDQKTQIKSVVESFQKTRQQYVDGHKAELDAAKAALKEARESGDDAKKQAAREQLRSVMSGLHEQRKAAIEQIKSLLTDEQKQILAAAREKRGDKPGRHGPRAGGSE